MGEAYVLLAELDGVTVRFATAEPGEAPDWTQVAPCGSVNSFARQVHALRTGARARLAGAAVAAAGPLVDDAIVMSRGGWRLDRRMLRDILGVERVHLVNDFAACALACTRLPDAVLDPVVSGARGARDALVIIGPGEGLGVAGLLPGPRDSWRPVTSEGGHVALAAAGPRQTEVLEALADRFDDRVSAEDVLSRPGLVALHAAVRRLAHAPDADLAPEAVAHAAREGCEYAREAFSLFSAWLGAFSRDTVLMLGARGGVRLTSAWLLATEDLLDRPAFRAAFGDAGRMRPYLDGVPVHLMRAGAPTLLGLSTLFTASDGLAADAPVMVLDC